MDEVVKYENKNRKSEKRVVGVFIGIRVQSVIRKKNMNLR